MQLNNAFKEIHCIDNGDPLCP